MEPTGAPSAFDRQNVTVSTWRTTGGFGSVEYAGTVQVDFDAYSVSFVADLFDDMERVDAAASHVVRIFDFDAAGGCPMGANGFGDFLDF